MENNKMSLKKRAKQFIPFAALDGFEEALKQKEKEHELNIFYKRFSKDYNNINEKLKNIKKMNNCIIQIFYETDSGLHVITCKTKELLIKSDSIQIENLNINSNKISKIILNSSKT